MQSTTILGPLSSGGIRTSSAVICKQRDLHMLGFRLCKKDFCRVFSSLPVKATRTASPGVQIVLQKHPAQNPNAGSESLRLKGKFPSSRFPPRHLRGQMASIATAPCLAASVRGGREGRGESATPQRFAVLITGHAPEYAQEKYGGYGTMFVDLLRDPGEEWEMFYVVDGDFPSEEAMERFDAFVVTGSRHDAHADDEWIARLCHSLQRAHAMRKRVLGVCFGHQVVSRALGGKTGRAPADIGWDCGLREVTLTDAFFSKPYAQALPAQRRQLRILEFHRDQVSEVPPGGELLGSSARTRIEMFAVGENVLCVQGHPEFTTHVVEDLADVCLKRGTLSEREAEATKESVKTAEPDREALQNLLKGFLKRPLPKEDS